MSDKIKILLADDHPLVRKGFRALLEELDFVTAEPLLRILSLELLQSRRDYMFIAQSPRYIQNPEGIVCQYVAQNI